MGLKFIQFLSRERIIYNKHNICDYFFILSPENPHPMIEKNNINFGGGREPKMVPLAVACITFRNCNNNDFIVFVCLVKAIISGNTSADNKYVRKRCIWTDLTINF